MTRDSALFNELLKPHYNDALKYCRALCATWSASDAGDVLQQSFLLALENFQALKDESKFRSWFFKIITTTFYSSIRKHFWKKFLPLDSGFHIKNDIPEVFSRAEQTEHRMQLNRALSVLNAKERSALLLFEIADFSIEEITAMQGEKSISAVKSRLSRARKKLKAYFENNQNRIYRENPDFPEYNGDIEDETLNLISEIRTER